MSLICVCVCVCVYMFLKYIDVFPLALSNSDFLKIIVRSAISLLEAWKIFF